MNKRTSMPAPDLSICIVNWNGQELLRQCLDSIRIAALGIHVETLVVDNASADGSVAMVESQYGDVKLIRNAANAGFARANNQAAAAGTGRHLLFLNNDTILTPGCLAALVGLLDANPDIGMAGPRLIGRDGRPQRSYRYRPTLGALLHRLAILRWTGIFRRDYRRYRRREFDPAQQKDVEMLMGAAMCMPRAVFEQCGGWDEHFPFGVEDIDLCARVAKTHRLVFFPSAEIRHLGRMSTRKNAGFAHISYECGYAHYVRKHFLGPAGVWLYKTLRVLDLPVALIVESGRSAWRRLRHGPPAPGRFHSDLAALWHFSTRGLTSFWRA